MAGRCLAADRCWSPIGAPRNASGEQNSAYKPAPLIFSRHNPPPVQPSANVRLSGVGRLRNGRSVMFRERRFKRSGDGPELPNGVALRRFLSWISIPLFCHVGSRTGSDAITVAALIAAILLVFGYFVSEYVLLELGLRHTLCSNCYYSLKHLESEWCPECGQPLEKSDRAWAAFEPVRWANLSGTLLEGRWFRRLLLHAFIDSRVLHRERA